MQTRPSYSLTPMFGLGSYNRDVGAVSLSSPRTRKGCANRVYQYMKNKVGAFSAINMIQMQVFGANTNYYGSKYNRRYNTNNMLILTSNDECGFNCICSGTKYFINGPCHDSATTFCSQYCPGGTPP
jgi:hypothetical protein